MSSSMSADAGNWLIYLAGSNSIQSELLAVFIEKETGLPCRIVGDGQMFPARLVADRRSIIFSDCQNLSARAIVAGMWGFTARAQSEVYIVFFNVDRTLEIESELLQAGLWGLFYEGDPLSSLPRGIESIRKGEIWMSRQVMSDCLINLQRHKQADAGSGKALLTGREREVLLMLSRGLRNDRIAAEMAISVNTVRSHLYRIFKKLEVGSRQQASIWAQRNL